MAHHPVHSVAKRHGVATLLHLFAVMRLQVTLQDVLDAAAAIPKKSWARAVPQQVYQLLVRRFNVPVAAVRLIRWQTSHVYMCAPPSRMAAHATTLPWYPKQ